MRVSVVALMRWAPLISVIAGTRLARCVNMSMIIMVCLLLNMSVLLAMRMILALVIIKVCTFSSMMASSGLLAVRFTTLILVMMSPLPHMPISRLAVALLLMTLFMAFGFLCTFVPRIARASLVLMVLMTDGSFVMATFVLVSMRLVPNYLLRIDMRRRIMLCLLVRLSAPLVVAGRRTLAGTADTVSIRLVSWMCGSTSWVAARFIQILRVRSM